MSKVIVVTNTNQDSPFFGQVLTESPNREGWVSMAVASTSLVFSKGILNYQKRQALIQGERATLEAFIAENKIVEGTELPGKIVALESFEPFYPGQNPKQTPDGELCIVKDAEGTIHNIYRRTEYDPTGDGKDVLIQHTDLIPAEVTSQAGVFASGAGQE